MIDKISKNKSIDYDYEIINQTEYEEYRKDYCEHIKQLNKIKKELNNKLKNNKSNSIANKKWMSTFTEFEQIEKLNSKTIYELIDNIYIEENGGIKIKFRYQDEFIQAIDFIEINNCAIIQEVVKMKDRMEVNNIYEYVSKKKNQSRKEKR